MGQESNINSKKLIQDKVKKTVYVFKCICIYCECLVALSVMGLDNNWCRHHICTYITAQSPTRNAGVKKNIMHFASLSKYLSRFVRLC